MLYTRTVEPRTFELLRNLMSLDILKDFYLVGGTALALQKGHRFSVDLDLFTTKTFDASELKEALTNQFDDFVLQLENLQERQLALACLSLQSVNCSEEVINLLMKSRIKVKQDKNTAVINLTDFMRIQNTIVPSDIEKKENDSRKDYDKLLKERSKAKMYDWPDSIELSKKKKLEERKKEFFIITP